LIAAALACSFPAGTARAEPPGIAVVDLTRLFQAHPETKAAEAAFEARRKENRDRFLALSNQLKELLDRHQTVTRELIAAGPDATAEQKKLAEDLLDQAAKLEAAVAKLSTTQQRDLEQEFLAEKQRILTLIAEAVAAFNQDGRYALVLDRSALSSTGLPQVLHAPGATDVTEEILRLFPEPAKK
jgi:Skp family chaperone for outer membrane proteins